MAEQTWSGTPASPGIAVGSAWRLPDEAQAGVTVPPERREHERATALAALAAAVEELHAVARSLPTAEAEIVETGTLMGEDPALIQAVEDMVLTSGRTASEAILAAADVHAQAIAAVGDETLAARADDVQSLGRRAARLARGAQTAAPPNGEAILIAHDLGPADVAELAPALAGIALDGGGATAHAAIVARSLGIPMVTGVYEGTREIPDGALVLLDGSSGAVVVAPSAQRTQLARAEMRERRVATQREHELRDRPAMTTDGMRVSVLANVASRGELELALRAGAEGIGLLRSELAFLGASHWPTQREHAEAIEPILGGLENRTAVVRVLDFGVDKSPPFLQDVPERGIELLLRHREAFVSQLRAILLAGQRHEVRILLPMVETVAQLHQSRELLGAEARTLGVERIPQLGSMIETPLAVENAGAIARDSDFLSIGTNDLTASTLGADRFGANSARSHHPLVLRSIARSVAAAHDAGIPIEVCGEAASDPIMLPLLVGLGIDAVSVGAARVGTVRGWIRELSAAEVSGLARSALTMDTAEEVEWAARPLAAEHSLVR
jgi:phosphoenolpyruvate-protein phosphotransferase